MPMPRLTGPVSEPAGFAIAPVGALQNELPLHLASRILVDLFAEGQWIHVELSREIVDSLFQTRSSPEDGQEHETPHPDPH